ncbi:enoyl-CoA hydratase/isomerase family protein [Niallia endozanthoxylica]|uniref:Enoyl-CoA hydratase n=1 Tax=Niallia endozanthoxylica TaxID=2036016 RepID=A0A5J5H8S4_9BACI|nr:enoyl-CoA hydratase-related protein [Niallia endozanthoxylica]KAA9017011.1 enoyl-CoA hydratase [Niallia endozanthoxylica]
MNTFEYIERFIEDGVGVIQLNRPRQLNALNRKMIREIVTALEQFDQNDEVVSILVTGKGRAFSAGADIDEMAGNDSVQMELLNQFADWDRISLIKKPIIGAVKGFVFGGGFELALSLDILIAANGTQFSFPEVQLGVMPGAGGTQRLTKIVGRAKALEWVWTGDRIPAEMALRYGIINQIVSEELLMEESMKFAKRLAKQPPLSLRLIKDSINKAVDYSLYEGMQYERKNFYLLFSSQDQKEGMQAFIEKRKAEFRGR